MWVLYNMIVNWCNDVGMKCLCFFKFFVEVVKIFKGCLDGLEELLCVFFCFIGEDYIFYFFWFGDVYEY